jgi:hypothetical protein
MRYESLPNRRIRVTPETQADRHLFGEISVPLSWWGTEHPIGTELIVPPRWAAQIATALRPRTRETLMHARINRRQYRRGVR